jgi:SPP1 family predicted phage head-tail adaptor
MRIGKLRHPIEVLKDQARQGNEGSMTNKSQAVEAVIWGAIRPMGTDERVEAAKIQGGANYMLKVRGMGVTLTPKRRIRFEDVIYEVVGVMNQDERNIEFNVPLKRVT